MIDSITITITSTMTSTITSTSTIKGDSFRQFVGQEEQVLGIHGLVAV